MGSTALGTRALCAPDSKEVALSGGQGVQGRAPLLGSRRWGLLLFVGHKLRMLRVQPLAQGYPMGCWDRSQVSVGSGQERQMPTLLQPRVFGFVFMEGGCSPKIQLPGSQAVFLDSKLADVCESGSGWSAQAFWEGLGQLCWL